MRRFLLCLCLAAACSKDQPQKPMDIQRRVTLERATSCDSLTMTVQDTAVRQMRAQMDAYKTGFGPGVGSAGGDATPAASAGAPASYTTTNTQVAGVDEADFVKNDGTRIFVLSGRNLFAARSWPPQDLALAGKLAIEGWPSSMFLAGDRVVVISSIWGPYDTAGVAPVPMCALGSSVCVGPVSTTKLSVVDVSDLSAPALTAQVYLPGYATGSRRIGDSLRVVLGDSVRWPTGVRWWPEYDAAVWQDKTRFAAAIDALENANEAIIRSTPVTAWFPPGQRKAADGTAVDLSYSCADFYLANAPERLGLVTVATLDLSRPDAGFSRASIVGEAGIVYATAERLYVAASHWWWWRLGGQRDYTYLHEFDISDPLETRYVASGGVEGHPGDSFAFDEKDGYLRVATSTLAWTEDPAGSGSFHAVAGSRLAVLRSDTLELAGELPSIVDGERLTAMRFVGDAGFAVTFRNVDPLATIDLSDPANPRKIAELTLPGFSTYLQPIDPTHLLAVGVELPLDSSGRPIWSERALQLSLFDVADLAHPARTAQHLVGTASAYSEALWDHHAFNWYRPDPAKPGLLAIPFSDWTQSSWLGFTSDVRVFSVDPSGSIADVGALGMNDVYIQQGTTDWTYWYRPWVRRSVMATDQVGQTFVYAIADAGIRTAALASLGTPVATLLFPRTP